MSSPRVALLSVEPVETRTKLNAQIKLKITFELYEELPEEIEWEMAMAWDGERKHDQVLDTVEVGPLQVGKHQFLFDASEAPDYSKVREEDVTDVAVLFLRCSYRGNMFARVAFFVSHVYVDEKLRETPPEKPQLDMAIGTRHFDRRYNLMPPPQPEDGENEREEAFPAPEIAA
ncbi:Histone chaperone asf1 [Aphelenchoides besseyi]|nr:Histone chaperone asf1 [Aphelenchoides besseyi]